MAEEDNMKQNRHASVATKKVLPILAVVSLVMAMICFVVVSLLPRPEGPLFKAPLRSILSGLGMLGVAYPPYLVSLSLKKRAAASPYFELAFIRTGFTTVAFVCFSVSLLCIGLGVYALIERMLDPV